MPDKHPDGIVDKSLVELAGRNWLASQLFRAGLEVARPERDRGIDLIAYLDMDNSGSFIACPIQMKAASKAVFSLFPKYERFHDLILAYVWNVETPSHTTCFALTYPEAYRVAETMGYTKRKSWTHGVGPNQLRGWTTTKPSDSLRELLAPYEMNTNKWRDKIARSHNSRVDSKD
jgi:hypothetical protein